MPEIGERAPEFTLRSHDGQEVSLGQFSGQKYVILSIFPLAFTGG